MISRAVSRFLSELLPEEDVKYDEPLSDYCSFRTGGNAGCVAVVNSDSDLKELLNVLIKTENEYVVLGNGTNVLISDKGYNGVVIVMGPGMSRIHWEGDKIYAQAGASLAKVALVALKHGLAGMEFAAGIPGTVGGAVVMNAGAYGGDMSQVVDTVSVLNGQCELMDLENATMEFGYRTSAIKNRSFVVTEASFLLRPGDRAQIEATIKENDRLRREKQPIGIPSAGSSFKRPPGNYAGKLIMDAGFKGYRIGGAQVSEKHCGFIVNTGGATSADIAELMYEVQQGVRERFKVLLLPEIVFLGDFDVKPRMD